MRFKVQSWLFAGGVIGKWDPDSKSDQDVKVYFSNPDLLFAGEHSTPRLGQGGFAVALKSLFKEVCALLSAPIACACPQHFDSHNL